MNIMHFDNDIEKEIIDSANATSEWISKCKTKEEFLKNFKLHEYDEYSKLGESMLECHFVVCVTAWNKNIEFTKDDYEQMKAL